MDTQEEETTRTAEEETAEPGAPAEPEETTKPEEAVEPEAKAEPPKPGTKVEVGTLEPNQSFTFERKEYVVSAVYPFGVMAVPPTATKKRKPVEKIPTDTIVTVK